LDEDFPPQRTRRARRNQQPGNDDPRGRAIRRLPGAASDRFGRLPPHPGRRPPWPARVLVEDWVRSSPSITNPSRRSQAPETIYIDLCPASPRVSLASTPPARPPVDSSPVFPFVYFADFVVALPVFLLHLRGHFRTPRIAPTSSIAPIRVIPYLCVPVPSVVKSFPSPEIGFVRRPRKPPYFT
jgi:hypothetical protein